MIFFFHLHSIQEEGRKILDSHLLWLFILTVLIHHIFSMFCYYSVKIAIDTYWFLLVQHPSFLFTGNCWNLLPYPPSTSRGRKAQSRILALIDSRWVSPHEETSFSWERGKEKKKWNKKGKNAKGLVLVVSETQGHPYYTKSYIQEF